MRNIKVSIIMPSKNVVSYIEECMDSVINQTLKEIEIICVDANSTDGTKELLEYYANKDSRVKLVIDEKGSSGYANNKAIDMAVGEYIGIVETDDYISSDMFEKLYYYAKKTNADVVKGDYDSFSGEGKERRFISHNILGDKKMYYKILNAQKHSFLFGVEMFNWAGIYKRDFLNQYNIRHQETPGAAFQDNGFWFQVFALASKIYFVHESFYRYRKDNPNSSINSKNKVFCMCDEYDFIEDKLKKYPEIWEKNFYPYVGKRYGACAWTLKKVAPEFREVLCERLQCDFRRLLKDSNEVNKVFSSKSMDLNKELKLLLTDSKKYLDLILNKLNMYESNRETLINEIKNRTNIVIYGCGNWGTELQQLLQEEGIEIYGFCDSSEAKWDKIINGKKVFAFRDLKKDKEQYFFVIASARYRKDIAIFLLENGIKNEDIIFYRHEKILWD